MNKSELRKKYLDKRKMMTTQEVEKCSHQITQFFFEFVDLTNVQRVHLFLPIQKNNEFDTWLMIDVFRTKYPHIQLIIPKTDFKNHSMQNFLFTEQTELLENRYGILEPVDGVEVQEENIDLVITPLLIFDENGYRVGYGGGFYDRFFQKCRKDIQRVGVCFEKGIDQITDLDQYDEKLTYCITPTETYLFFVD